MKGKALRRVIAIGLAASMASAVALVPVVSALSANNAEGTTEQKTYHYVALGDSITAGMGLNSGDRSLEAVFNDPAFLLHTDANGNLTSTVDGAYPALYASEYLQSLCASYGYNLSTANLGSSAFTAADVNATIKTDPSIIYEYPATAAFAKTATSVLKVAIEQGLADESILNTYGIYPKTYNKYLEDADLVSILIGANDIGSNLLGDMVYSDNCIIAAIGTGMELTMFGCNTETIIAGALQTLTAGETPTIEDILEAITYLQSDSIQTLLETGLQNAMTNIRAILDSVETLNGDTKIALLGMYNPYGNSFIYHGDEEGIDIGTTMTNLITMILEASLEEVTSEEIVSENTETTEVPTDEVQANVLTAESTDEAQDCLDQLEEKVDELNAILEQVGVLTIEDILDSTEEELKALIGEDKTVEDLIKLRDALVKLLEKSNFNIGYVVQYLLVGQTMDSIIQEYNTQVKAIADADDAVTFVDIYDIPNEYNTDPHPNAAGHEAIAELLASQIQSVVVDQLDPCSQGHTPEVIPAVAPTTTSTGLTEGSKCSVCGAILKEQTVVPKLSEEKTSGDTTKKTSTTTTSTSTATTNTGKVSAYATGETTPYGLFILVGGIAAVVVAGAVVAIVIVKKKH